MTRSPLRRLVFGTLRRVLYLWVRSETINQSAFTLKLDRSKPVFYVLQQPSLSDLAVVDTECRKAGLPRPVLPVAVGELLEPAAFFYLTPEPDWLGRQDKRGISPTLQRLVSALSQHAVDDAQIIPVSVFWGQSPDRETSPWKLLFADSWAVTGRLRRLVSIRKLCTLKGGVSTGRRPYFQFANARYSAEWLVLRTDLIGKLLWLQLEDEDDARFVSVSNERGEFLGVLRAAPPWHRLPHTLYMRQAIRALEKRRAVHLSGQCDAVEELIRYAETDMMGIVYHANYLPWFEIGRTTLLKELGLPYRQLEAEGYGAYIDQVEAENG